MCAPRFPEETPISILAGLAQMLQSLLDTDPGEALTVPRSWLQRWREDVRVALATLRHERHER